jgi:glycosyltransferase involved in cell wall biosynthesis
VEDHLNVVVNSLPEFLDYIILVNDNSPDGVDLLIKEMQKQNNKIVYVKHMENQGVGGAMVTGFKEACSLGCDYIIKLDGDGQMDPQYIPKLLDPLINKHFHFSKGNRFTDFAELKKMPITRRIGNLVLSFMIKAASGYWALLDPTNGFFCIKREILEKVDLKRLEKRFFFESSLIIELYYTGAKIIDVPIPAKYEGEKSNLSVLQTLITFPRKIVKAFLRRFLLRYFLYDFTIFSIYLLIGLPLILFGIIFGAGKWIYFSSANIEAPIGTVMLATLAIVLGFQLLLSVIQYDISSENPFSIYNKQYE